MFRRLFNRWREPKPTLQLIQCTPQVSAILKAAGYREATDPEFAEIVRCLDEGRAILAVKEYREATGASLLQAKLMVDRMIADCKRTD